MPFSRLDLDGLRHALRSLGERIVWPDPIELVLVGGAAAILTDLLPHRLTGDCDVVLHVPREAWGAVDRAVLDVAREQGLAENWLNAEVQATAHRLPPDWRERAHPIVAINAVRVLAVDRLDLLAMKAVAGRAVDRQDVLDLRPAPADLAFVRGYLDDLRRRHPHEATAVADALDFLDDLSRRDRP